MKIVFNISFEGSRKDMEFLTKPQYQSLVEVIKQNQEERQSSEDSEE